MLKEKAQRQILDIYEERGATMAIAVARRVLELSKGQRNFNSKKIINGEICETVLEIALMEYCKKNLSAFYSKGLILKNREISEDFLTEIDLVLFTPQKIVIWECKGHNGDKKIKEQCTICRAGEDDYDVYKQNCLHRDAIIANFERFRIANPGTVGCVPTQLALFNFSLGDVYDMRPEQNKLLMPLIEIGEVEPYIEQCIKGPVCWNVEALGKAVRIIEANKERLRKQHLAFVKSIH